MAAEKYWWWNPTDGQARSNREQMEQYRSGHFQWYDKLIDLPDLVVLRRTDRGEENWLFIFWKEN